jgi:3-hydroxyisobutyrate dehydrogenase
MMKLSALTLPCSVTFIGLGVMGYPMAGHLARAGHAVTVYNRTQAKAEQWISEHGGQRADTPAEAARQADVVFTCVGNDDDVRSVVLGDQGAFAGMRPGSILVDHTTASAQLARELGGLAQHQQLAFLDAPVSGGNVGAINGTLAAMVGGDRVVFDKVHPVLAAYAKAATWMGPSGSGQLTKMVNQVAIAGLLQGLAEAIAFGQKAGLHMPTVLEVISKGAAQSWQMEHRGPTMIQDQFDFGFAVDWMRKDLKLVMEEAQQHQAHLPVTERIDQFYAELQAQGGGRRDTSSLIQRLR